MDGISHLVEEYGIDKAIGLHEERLSYAINQPRNPFFIEVVKDSEQKLKQLKTIKNETEKI